ncbi:rhomboid family intramembrane serine protease [Clostridiaceae bacterium UIB06]|nr:rhomboid family intramembrane serine protease [Clostridiaceae bacterium UIB06]
MDTYIRTLIKKLCDIYGYRVIEFEDTPGLSSSWGIVKVKENQAEVVFFSSLHTMQKLNINNFINYAGQVLQCENIQPIQVLIDDDLKAEVDGEGVLHLNHKIYPQCGLILINNVDNKILYYTSGLEEKANELANCISHIRHEENQSQKTGKAIITYILIAVNLMIYALTAYLSGNIVDSNTNVLVFLGAKVNELISGGEYYRLVSCMFLHGGIVHVALNMYSLYALGPFVEGLYGKLRYTIIYFLAGIVSSLFSYIFSSHISVGASGAIFGLLGAALVFAVKMRDRIRKDFIINILSVIGINLVMGFSIPNVDNFGHLGGLVGGILSSFILFRRTQ